MAERSSVATVLHTSGLGPNKLQFALAQYAALRTPSINHQLWKVPAGQGKSRISHVMALLLFMSGLLLPGMVHMVFPTERLMVRDRDEFE